MSNPVALKKLDNELNKSNETMQGENPVVVYQTSGTGRYIYSVFHLIMSLIAIYLSFKCNKGYDMGSFVVAFCCPYIYIIYILATKGTCGILEGEKSK
jgi:hypothetical protein